MEKPEIDPLDTPFWSWIDYVVEFEKDPVTGERHWPAMEDVARARELVLQARALLQPKVTAT